MTERGVPDGTGRSLRPPSGLTPLDRAWRRRQWRLESAHDDFALHAVAGDPRAPIRAAAGLARFHRRILRENVQACRKATAAAGAQSDAAVVARQKLTGAVRTYRSAITELAEAVATFNARNMRFVSSSEGSVPRHVVEEAQEPERIIEPVP